MQNKLKSYEEFKKENYDNERVEEIISYMLNTNEELQQVLKNSEITFSELMESLTTPQKELLLQYDNLQTEILSIENYFIAKKVYEDLT